MQGEGNAPDATAPKSYNMENNKSGTNGRLTFVETEVQSS